MGLGPSLNIRQSQSAGLTPQLTRRSSCSSSATLSWKPHRRGDRQEPLLEERGEEGETKDRMGEEAEGDDGDPPTILARRSDPRARRGRPAARRDLTRKLSRATVSPMLAPAARRAVRDLTSSASLTRPPRSPDHLLDQLHGPAAQSAAWPGSSPRCLRRRLSCRLVEEIAASTGEEIELVEKALAMVQQLDPPGVGARSLAECLVLQARAADRFDPAMARMIDNLDLLAKGRMNDLKRICGVDDEDLGDMVRELRAYDPKPGCAFSASGAESVSPDVFVRRMPGGSFAVELNQERRAPAAGSTAATTPSSSRDPRTRRRGPGSECLQSAAGW